MPTAGMRSTPELTPGWLLVLRVSVVVFVGAAVVFAVLAARGAGSDHWAAAGGFAAAAVGQGAGLLSLRRRRRRALTHGRGRRSPGA
ncbi:hypothetical protein [Cellulomonas pakistanensis]|uniref:Uncharacterized protein n=1 Tax=Cellulomonas pakistanensis TaxID=992287 RepID=A0A919P9N6_9CELL|nr:hypothetical protein [Cellulomonas pakistanensis]GIG34954.1 hypothetical protein Cpa01nite_03350 [Cellulomonas pakistanensis]